MKNIYILCAFLFSVVLCCSITVADIVSFSRDAEGKIVVSGGIAGIPFVARGLENNMQFDKYHNAKTGHGFAAEDANALEDRLHGRSVEKTGLTNKLNGSDRVVDGVAIQTKYYDNPQGTLKAFFDKNGVLRYADQLLEVPADQYDDVVALFKEKIRRRELKNAAGEAITDPKVATELVKKGHYTYKQVRNIARAGNIDSLVFDAKNNLVVSTGIAGATFIISTALYVWNGADLGQAMYGAFESACASGLISMTTGVVSSQILKTRTAAHGTAAFRSGLKLVAQTKSGRAIIDHIAQISSGKALHGAASVNYVAKLARGGVVVAGVGTAVVTLPDLYRASWEKSISWKQFAKNFAVNAAGAGGALVGAVAGAEAGALVGSFVPVVGTAIGGGIGGIAGAFLGSWAAGSATRVAVDWIAVDDAEEMFILTQNAIVSLAMDYLLLEQEMESLMKTIHEKLTPEFLTQVYMSGRDDASREAYVYRAFEENVSRITAQRRKISLLPTQGSLLYSYVGGFLMFGVLMWALFYLGRRTAFRG